MNHILVSLLLISLAFPSKTSLAQSTASTGGDSTQTVITLSGAVSKPKENPEKATDSTRSASTFTGSIGLTNNGFSIIPTFSLNSPATIMNFYWRKGRFSFDPDIRLVPDMSKGGLLFWLRYRLIEHKKFSLRAGVHPAFSLVHKTLTSNGAESRITEVLRFVAGEIVPSYQITSNWGINAVYLHGSGLQKHGPQRTHVLFLNNVISNIDVGSNFGLTLAPSVFFLNVDGYTGSYFTATAILSRKNLPFTLQSTINQTFASDIPGNQNFMWNVMLAYNFSRTFKRVL